MLLISLTSGSSREDQIINAEYFRHSGYTEVLLQEDTTDYKFINSINQLYKDRERYIQNMNDYRRKDNEGTTQLVDLICEIVK